MLIFIEAIDSEEFDSFHSKYKPFYIIINHFDMLHNIKIMVLLLSMITLFTSCQQTTSSDRSNTTKEGMVKVTILYPNDDGKTFDMDYYATKHMPMVANLLGDSLKFLSIDKGMAGRTPEEPIPYVAIGYLYFDTLSAYQNAFAPHAEKIVSDIPNYTNIQPVIQVSEVLQEP